MKHNALSIRTFIGSKDYNISRAFYKELGFSESILSDKMCYFYSEGLGFYLQDYYVKAWINNSMVFLEVNSADEYYSNLEKLGLHTKYKNVKLSPVKELDWGKECFLHDPSGVLWHFGEFYS